MTLNGTNRLRFIRNNEQNIIFTLQRSNPRKTCQDGSYVLVVDRIESFRLIRTDRGPIYARFLTYTAYDVAHDVEVVVDKSV